MACGWRSPTTSARCRLSGWSPAWTRSGRFGALASPTGSPFIVADNGMYEAELNRVLRLMPSYGVRSLRSVRAYADVYVAVARFLHEQPAPKT